MRSMLSSRKLQMEIIITCSAHACSGYTRFRNMDGCLALLLMILGFFGFVIMVACGIALGWAIISLGPILLVAAVAWAISLFDD